MDDLTQEVMLRAFEKRSVLAPLSKQDARDYVLGIVHNVLRGYYGHARSMGAWPREGLAPLSEVDSLDDWLSARAFRASQQAPFEDPETVLLGVRKAEIFLRAFGELSTAEQEAIETWLTHMRMKAICHAKERPSPPPLSGRERVAIHRAAARLAELIPEGARGP